MRSRLIAAVTFGAVLCLAAPPALARPSRKDVAAAKKAEREAKKHEKKKEWSEARDALEHAVELDDTPARRVELAKVEEKLGHLKAAAAALRGVTDDAHASKRDKRKAQAELDGLGRRIPKLTIELSGADDAMISVDDVPVQRGSAVEVDPGERHIHAEASGRKPFDDTVTLKEGEVRTVEIALKPEHAAVAAAAPQADSGSGGGSSTAKTLGYVSLVVGGAGVVVGTVFALESRSTKQDLDATCLGTSCPSTQRDLYDKGKRQADIATAGFVVGGVGLALGAVLLIASPSPSKQKQARIVPLIGPGAVGVSGKF